MMATTGPIKGPGKGYCNEKKPVQNGLYTSEFIGARKVVPVLVFLLNAHTLLDSFGPRVSSVPQYIHRSRQVSFIFIYLRSIFNFVALV